MQKEVYADNVDVNGEAHETVGENIRNGAKSPEAIAKALQSDEITFDMQSIMNVLPFMNSSKKIVDARIKVNESKTSFTCEQLKINSGNNWFSFKDKVYGHLVGRVICNYAHNETIRINGDGTFGYQLVPLSNAPNNFEFQIFVVVDK